MIEYGRHFRAELEREWKNFKKKDLLPFFFLGGLVIGISGWDNFYSGKDRFNREITNCEKKMVSVDPPVYVLKTPNQVCQELDRGVQSQEIIARFEEQAEKDRPWGIGKELVGFGIAGAAFLKGIFEVRRTVLARRAPLESHSSEE